MPRQKLFLKIQVYLNTCIRAHSEHALPSPSPIRASLIMKHHKRDLRGRTLRQTAAVVAVVSLVLSGARLALDCIRAAVPALCACGMLIQLLESRSRPLGRLDKGRFIALAGAWATAAFCDCTAATDYWFVLDTPLQLLCMPLACASFLLSATAALVSISFSTAAGDAVKLEEPLTQPEEKVPLAAPEGADTLESLSPVAEDNLNNCMLAGHGACLHAAFVYEGVLASQLPGYCPCPRCETQDSISTGLPIVTPNKCCQMSDPTSRHLSSGSAGLLCGLEGETRHKQSYNSRAEKYGLEKGRSGERQVSKGSVFTPSHAREGRLLAGLASRENRRAANRGPSDNTLLEDGWPRTRTSEFCGWDFPRVTADAVVRHSKGICVEQHSSSSLGQNESLLTAASISTSASRSGKQDSEESCWSRCCAGSSPLLSEFLEDESAELEGDSHPEKEGCGAVSKYLAGRINTAHGIQYASFPDSQVAGMQGLEAGWKPYLSMLGFQAAGGCKRGVGRTKRIGDLKWLDVMIVDMEADVGNNFGPSAASRTCDV
ncbi:hypothetical protein Emed_001240 [Eimeria media]